ncbi:hypothetical protein [Mesorhizobium sp. B1-1-2]|uniref:hypothetical protein n=1 Tax=Mesorhizobium sp. B1-1-2 TaxID=2589982 RepID=UPI0011272EE3|nr:hypothetical protein [Mesorhizobium sp. B1-1-2]TPN79957.1 hypothetical protein FJ985_01620 [Mesorhizobium sp. B1-1-2]
MPNLGFGFLYNGNQALRIAFDNATDLQNESITSFGKFQFDSSNTQLGYVYDIYVERYDSRFQSGGYLGAWWFFNTAGDVDHASNNVSDAPTCARTVRWSSGAGSQIVYLHSNWWPFGYMPIVEFRTIDPALPANTFKGAVVDYTEYNSSVGFVESYAGYSSLTGALIDTNIYGSSSSRDAYGKNLLTSANPTYVVSTFQLPARGDALPNFEATPVSGQVPFLLTPTVSRLALPGRDVTDPNPDHFIFHEDKIPAKIMKAGDVNIAGSGTVDLICPLPLTPLTYMDFMIKRQSDAEFWNPPYFDSITSDKSLAFWYEVKSDRITITNKTSTAITVRYIIFADSDEEFTEGGKKIIYRGNDGIRDYVQIKRPGSSDLGPGLNDIMVDTRLAYMPLLAQGFLNWTSDFPTAMTGGNFFKGERMATVNFTNPVPRLLPFVKQTVVYPSNSRPVSMRNGYHKVYTDAGGWTGHCSGDSSWANVHDTSVDFYMAGDNPQTIINGNVNYNELWPSNSQAHALGLRYYIFGIPQSL